MPGIVIESAKQVYWPIPRCGSTTMKTLICEREGIAIPDGNVHIADFKYTTHPIPGYEDFTIVRNPFTRLQSLFNNLEGHFKGGAIYSRFGDKFFPEMTFEQFIRAVISIDDPDPHFDLQINQFPAQCTVIRLEEWKEARHENKSTGEDHYRHHLKTMVMKHYLPDFITLGYLLQ